MKIRKCKRYIADCGRGFWNRNDCLNHEQKCLCWKNPKHKTCLSCKHFEIIHDSNGMEHDPLYLQTWIEYKCNNQLLDYDSMFTPAHEKAPDININCPVWELKTRRK